MQFIFINHWRCNKKEEDYNFIEFKLFDFTWYSDMENKYCEMEIVLFNFEFCFRIEG
jgi:hypothetical protein